LSGQAGREFSQTSLCKRLCKALNGFIEFIKTIGAARLAAMAVVAAGLIGVFIFLSYRLSQPQMSVLFSDLAFEDSTEIVSQLDSLNVPYIIRNKGGTILVPQTRALRLRMTLAEQGVPTSGVVGYEIFDKTNTLGKTSFVQNLNQLRALEGELSRTISAIDRIKKARVHLVLPKKQLFSREKAEPSASIILNVRGSLDQSQIRAIQHLVASAVEGLSPGRISIVDETGRLLANGTKGNDGEGIVSSIDERTGNIENRLKNRISALIGNIVGPQKTRVEVKAEVNYKRVTLTSKSFDPNGQVVRSTQTKEQTSSALENANGEAVSVSNELPAAGADNANPNSPKTSENKNSTEEVVNYEISSTSKTEITEAGKIQRISVAVLIDGIYIKAADGTSQYQERPAAELEKISSLVRSVIGYNKARGDTVEVINLRFAPEPVPEQLEAGNEAFLNLTKDDYFQIGELVTLFLISLLVLLFVVRPLIQRIVAPNEDQPLGIEGGGGNAAQAGSAPQLTAPDGTPIPVQDGVPQLEAPDIPKTATATAIEVAQIAGKAQESTVNRVGELVKHNPTEAAAIIRQWLQEAA